MLKKCFPDLTLFCSTCINIFSLQENEEKQASILETWNETAIQIKQWFESLEKDKFMKEEPPTDLEELKEYALEFEVS